MAEVITFGEIMLRLNPPGYRRFVQADCFEASYAGGEANVAVSLSNFGVSTAFASLLPAHELGQCGVNALRRYGVDTSQIGRKGPRIGTYYVEKGASQRPSKVIYDRAGSSISLAERRDFDWHSILEGARWFHFTGITPALGPHLPDICLDALRTAKSMGIVVSCDLNYRKKLWSTQEAGRVMEKLLPFVDVCIANESDAADVFGIQAKGSRVEQGQLDHQAYREVARQLHARFGCQKVAITLRGSLSASDNTWGGMLYAEEEAFFSPTYTVHIVDRVGGGDSFGAALIYALLQQKANQEAIDFAAAASCLKHSIECDFNLVSLAEVESLAGGNASGRVER